MRILFLISSMHSGGAERVASTLANAWAARGDEVILMPTFSGRGECFYPLSQEIRLVYLADLVSSRVRTLWNRLARLLALRRFISSERPDVIVSFLPNVNVAAVLASIGFGIPVIVCERSDSFVMRGSHLDRRMSRLTYPFASGLVVQTQVLARKYVSSGQALRMVRVIPNPITRQIIDTQHNVGHARTKRILSVGRLVDQKQFDVLIKAFANLARIHPDWSLRIIGEGPLRAVLQKQIIDLGLEDRIELPGRSTTIGEEFAAADIFAFTSSCEGFPNALLEAMAVGVPCVTFDCPCGPREISLDGQVALLVPPNDERDLGLAMERLMVDADLRSSLGARARSSVIERFSLDNILKQWDELFKELGVKR
ncbi:MAG: glycosyltransferase family 4 protein [Candidatus Omnitrophica bacterium]|nr:glycosyltransferase family 4 protein [Candidatus Omnitrophota bacterium]